LGLQAQPIRFALPTKRKHLVIAKDGVNQKLFSPQKAFNLENILIFQDLFTPDSRNLDRLQRLLFEAGIFPQGNL